MWTGTCTRGADGPGSRGPSLAAAALSQDMSGSVGDREAFSGGQGCFVRSEASVRSFPTSSEHWDAAPLWEAPSSGLSPKACPLPSEPPDLRSERSPPSVLCETHDRMLLPEIQGKFVCREKPGKGFRGAQRPRAQPLARSLESAEKPLRLRRGQWAGPCGLQAGPWHWQVP